LVRAERRKLFCSLNVQPETGGPLSPIFGGYWGLLRGVKTAGP